MEDRWGGEMQYNDREVGLDNIYGESIKTNRWEALAKYQLPTSENIMLSFSANGHIQDSYYGDSKIYANQQVYFGQMTWDKQVERHDLLLGAVYRYTWYETETRENIDAALEFDTITTHLPGIFIQDEISLGDQFRILGGLRYDYNSIHGSIFTPRLNLKWNNLDKTDILRLSFGRGYRVANIFTEEHAAQTGSRTLEFEEDIKPETSWNTNLNYVKKIYTAGNTFIGIDASLFYTLFTSKIFYDYEFEGNKLPISNGK